MITVGMTILLTNTFAALDDTFDINFWLANDPKTRLSFLDRKSTRLNSSHVSQSRMPSSA